MPQNTYAGVGRQVEEKYGLMRSDIAGAIHEQMEVATARYEAFDAFRICARLLPERVWCLVFGVWRVVFGVWCVVFGV